MERTRETVKTRENTHQYLQSSAATSGKRGFAAEPQNVPKEKGRKNVKSSGASFCGLRTQDRKTREAGFTVRENLRRSAEAKWSYRSAADGVPPDADPSFTFSAHSAWCAYKASGACTVKLKRPQITKSEWRDKDGGSTSKGVVGEELTLSAAFNSDTAEEAGVTFKIYKDGESPLSATPVAQLGAVVEGGKAEAVWTYRYKHDAENPLKAKPKYFFTADTPRAKQVKSGTVEIGATVEICLQNEIEYEIKGLEISLIQNNDTDSAEKVSFNGGKIEKKDLIPAEYSLSFEINEKKEKDSVFEGELPTEREEKTIYYDEITYTNLKLSIEKTNVIMVVKPKNKLSE